MKLIDLIHPHFGFISICNSFLGDSRNEFALDDFDKDGRAKLDSNYHLYADLNLEDPGVQEGRAKFEYDTDDRLSRVFLSIVFDDVQTSDYECIGDLLDFLGDSEYFEVDLESSSDYCCGNVLNEISINLYDRELTIELYPKESSRLSFDELCFISRAISTSVRREDDGWASFLEQCAETREKNTLSTKMAHSVTDFFEVSRPFTEAILRFMTKLEEMDLAHYWDLRELTAAFPHLKIREGYTLDGCLVGDTRNAQMKLYIYRKDSKEEYFPGSEHINPPNDVIEDTENHVFYGGGPGAFYEVPPPIPFVDGQVIAGTISFPAFDTVPPISDYIEMEFTPEAILEALLLMVEACGYLPHRWHGGYARGIVVTDTPTLLQACSGKLAPSMIEYLRTIKNYLPEMRMLDNSRALISYCRWSEFGGLTRLVQLATFNGRTVRFAEQSVETLADYDGGLIF